MRRASAGASAILLLIGFATASWLAERLNWFEVALYVVGVIALAIVVRVYVPRR